MKRAFPIPREAGGDQRFAAEHMWLHVTRIGPGGILEGVLANHPHHLPRLRYGARVTCTLEQIEAVDYPDEEA